MQFVNSWKYIQKLFGQKLDRSYAVLTSYQSLHVLSMNFPLSQFRVATHQKVKNSLTFHWSLNSFHWPFINQKQSIHFSFFASHQYFSVHFQPLGFCGKKRNLEESIHDENHWPQLLHVSGNECQIDRFAAYFSSSPKKNAFQSLEENLWTINQKTAFPYFLLTLTTSKTFPDIEKFLFFPDRGDPAIVP